MFSGQDGKQKGAKTGINSKGGAKARQQLGVSLRNKNREDMLNRRRRGEEEDAEHADPNESLANSAAPHVAEPDNPWSYNAKSVPEHVPLRLLPQFASMAVDADPQVMFHGVLMIRKLLSVNEAPPIQEVVDSGIVPTLISYLPRDDWVDLQFEAAWAVSNVASGTQAHTHLVITNNAVPEFVRLLESPNEEVREQATWAIGNIAGDSSECRNYILSLGAMEKLIRAVNTPVSKITVLRNAVWALSNVCRSKPPPPLEEVQPALPVLAQLLNHSDKEVVTDACWAVSYISDGPIDRIQRVLQSNVLERVIAMLTAPSVSMQTPALRTIGNVVTGNDVQTQTVIDQGALPAFHFLLNHPRRAIKKEACWCLSNITAGSVEQIQAMIAADLYPVIIQTLDAQEYEVKKEAVWCIANTTSGGTREQLRYLVDIGVLNPLCRILTLYDVKIVTVALEAIENFLQLGMDDMREKGLARNPYTDILLSNGGFELIEQLQEHQSPELYNQSVAVLETYFEVNDATASVQGVAPTPQGSSYNFAAPQQPPSGGGYTFQ